MRQLKWLASFPVTALRGFLLSRYVSDPHPPFPIRVADPFLRVVIRKAPEAKLIINGILRIHSYLHSRDPVVIRLAERSTMVIDGDLILGNGTQIVLYEGAHLYIGGRRKESASGITERSRIMVKKRIDIGSDCILAWGVYITDCDWHKVQERESQSDVSIGDHVWVAANATILKGSKVGSNCIIGAHSLVAGAAIPDGSLVAGVPGRVVRRDVSWRRDLEE